MNEDMFRLFNLENESEFFTNSPFKLLAWSSAVMYYNYTEGIANEIAELCYDLYVSFEDNVNGIDLIDFICEQYNDLPYDFKEIKNLLVSYLD